MSRSKRSGKRSGTAACVTDHVDEPSNCIICLERVSCRGKLSVCSHWFCFPCILEWAENTNTCPICKARFRCITKIHVSPFRSPPIKVRVGDKDQRVWNDDEDLVAEDVLDAIDPDDLDDDYEPPHHLDSPWTRSLGNGRRQQGNNIRGNNTESNRPLQLDQYDLDDSFIDDTDEALQTYLYSAYSRGNDFDFDGGHINNPKSRNIYTNNMNDTSDTGDSDVEILSSRVTRSPYSLRNNQPVQRRSPRSEMDSFDRLPQVTEVESCSSASTNSFIVSDNESAGDDLDIDWVPLSNHSNNARNKSIDLIKATKQISRGSQRRKRRSSKSPQSQRLAEQKEHRSKQRNQQTLSSDSEFQEPSSSRNSKTKSQPNRGWIRKAEKHSKARATSSTISSLALSDTREKASTSHGKELLNSKQNKTTNVNHSNSDSDEPMLRDITNQQEKQRNRAGKTSKPTLTKKKAPIKHSSKLKQGKNFLSSASRANAGKLDDTTDESSGDDNSLSDAAIIGPTPHAKTTRSIFTKRRHKSPVTDFSHNKNAASHSNNNCYISCQLKISPLFEKGDQKRKRRVLSLSSESE
ncbi:micronuclear linker histone polyprotein-like [Acropora muricata]|uniref:micronuclear linker histone polyprotein-like n=1 Tax=Acropora muricata TaxID=159855 RepID=UPI0034E6105B